MYPVPHPVVFGMLTFEVSVSFLYCRFQSGSASLSGRTSYNPGTSVGWWPYREHVHHDGGDDGTAGTANGMQKQMRLKEKIKNLNITCVHSTLSQHVIYQKLSSNMSLSKTGKSNLKLILYRQYSLFNSDAMRPLVYFVN